MDKPLTLLYVITGTGIGGAEKALLELVRRVDRARYRVAVCCLKRPGCNASSLSRAADEFHHLDLSEAAGLCAVVNFLPATLRLARIMRRVRPDIVHCFLFRASIMGRLAACFASCPPVIAAIRVNEQSPFKYFLERLTRRLVSCYTAVSEEVRRGMIECAHVLPDTIHTIYNGIECAGAVAPEQREETARDVTRLALIGRLQRQKGHGTALEAVRMLRVQGRRVHLFLAGDGPDEDRLRVRARSLGTAECVTFCGIVDDMVAFMEEIDIVVMPSLWEGMPNVLLEAMLAGRPIIASRLSGIQEMVRHGESALLCAPGSAAELADAITRLMDDPDLARRLVRAAHQAVLQRFDIANTVAAMQAIYENVLRGRNPGRK